MSAIYDNWERLVAAVLKKEQLWQLFHDNSRSPSVLSEASSFSSSLSLGSFDLGSSSRRALPKLVLISDFSPAFGVDDLRLASGKLLGRGTFGRTYAAAMDNGVKIVVKRLESVSMSEPDFKHHVDIIGNIRHENVAALRAYYYCENEKLMLYDYYSKGSVHALLHGRTDESWAHVDWETRVKIAIGAARGIAEIHTQNGGTLLHGNIKSSNILLNRQQYGCVSDLGLANMIETTFMPTARCYAPEVRSTRNVSQAMDVYGFGIVLFELLTRKSTTHLPGAPEPVDLVKLVGSAKSRERASKVFDPDLLKRPAIREDMVKMLQIGIKCVSKSIKKRPIIFEVVKMLEDIFRLNPEIYGPFAKGLVFIKIVNPTFDLEDMLSATAEVLGKGTFGYCYKAIFDNGDAIVVKRLKDVIVTYQDFQQQMEVIGRIRHENVFELKAYHFSTDEKLLVYDYYNQDSLSGLLHGQKSTDRTPLDWDTRLKIVVGAARGIAHIHRQDGGRLVHGNIKSSNIFVNEKKYGTVTDVGLTKLFAPIKLSAMATLGYFAPEVTDARKVSQASDVYSFGVVLLELVSGKQSQESRYGGRVISLVESVKSAPDEWSDQVLDAKLKKHPNDEEAMMQVLKLAMDCVAVLPEHRPRMPEVLKMLEEISGIAPFNESIFEDVLEETPWQTPIESRLEDILEDLLPSLAP